MQVPGFGFLRDEFPDPFMVRWEIADGWATSDDLPGVRIPGSPFMGTIGLAPGPGPARADHGARAGRCSTGAGSCCRPTAADAVPADPAIAAEALRTIPPRETGRQRRHQAARQGRPAAHPGRTPTARLFSAGDAHFAQGDCETCGTAIEMRATLRVRFAVHKGGPPTSGIRDLQFARDDYYLPPEFAAPRRFFATTGLSVTRDGENRARGPHPGRPQRPAQHDRPPQDHGGWTRQQAYAICSVAVDLKISQVVDVPNLLVSAFLPLDIFA